MRDIEKYADEYLKEGFEDVIVEYRRKKVLSVINKAQRTSKIVEIGCGKHPIFEFFNDFDEYVFYEPASELFGIADRLKNNDSRIKGINAPFGDTEELGDFTPDIVLLSSLLHELEEPDKMLDDIKYICGSDTLVHINVPNANSFHRILAKSMGLISDTKEMSDRNVTLQQNRVYDLDELINTVEQRGFQVVESGSYFIKPFTHAQMWSMIKNDIINEQVLDGLYQLGEELRGLGSEIYVNCKLSGK